LPTQLLIPALAAVADPRGRRGIRHRLPGLLALSVCAVIAGTRSFTAIAQWAADLPPYLLGGLGADRGVPSESTFRRTLHQLDADHLDRVLGQWAAHRTAGWRGLRAVAVVAAPVPLAIPVHSDSAPERCARPAGWGQDRARVGAIGRIRCGAMAYRIEFYEDESGRKPVLGWIRDDLDVRERRVLGTAMREILQQQGVGVCGTPFGRQLGGGLFEFRLRESELLLRVFCHAYGERIVLLVRGYDKGADPSAKRQTREIAEARRRLARWRQHHDQ